MEWKGMECKNMEWKDMEWMRNAREWKGLNEMNGKGWEMEGYVMEGLSTLIVP